MATIGHINAFPYEILSTILTEAARCNERDGVSFTFGLSQAPQLLQTPTIQKYVRGNVPPDMLRWDATSSIRQVCWQWHEWALRYSLRDIYLRKWKGSERWAELSQKRESYGIYELIDKPSGAAVYRDPFCSLRKTVDLLSEYPRLATNVRRLWFDGFYVCETDLHVFKTIQSCSNLTSVSIPWTTLRHLTSQAWSELLVPRRGLPLESLEILAVELTGAQAKEAGTKADLHALESDAVDFSKLRRLKFYGDTSFMPVTDQDMKTIARTATNLEEFYLTNMSTITIEGVMSIVKASQNTLRVLEHSPRSDDGFYHPHPGIPSTSDHLCEVLANCSRLEDVSVSLPYVCATLFSNPDVRWKGDFQARATNVCGCDHTANNSNANADALQALLSQARRLIEQRASSHLPTHLLVELFFSDFIFEPHLHAAHGDFRLGELSSGGLWPAEKAASRKGPYGSTGLYGKEDEGVYEQIKESDFLEGMRRRWTTLVA